MQEITKNILNKYMEHNRQAYSYCNDVLVPTSSFVCICTIFPNISIKAHTIVDSTVLVVYRFAKFSVERISHR